MSPAINGRLKLNAFFGSVIFYDLISTESLVALLTVHKRIGKTAEMSGCHPCLGIHEDCTVNTYIVGILLNKLLPPRLFNIILKLDSKISVIPGIRKSAIYLRSGIYESSSFRKSHDLVHCFFHSISFHATSACHSGIYPETAVFYIQVKILSQPPLHFKGFGVITRPRPAVPHQAVRLFLCHNSSQRMSDHRSFHPCCHQADPVYSQ